MFRPDVYLTSNPTEALDFESSPRRKRQSDNDLTTALRARYRQLKTAAEEE